MTFQHLEQDMANAVGFVMDRSVEPAKFLCQGFLVSKSRFVTLASEVFHYTETPGALTIYFPHPDISMGVKTVSLNNDFDKVQARNTYLAQRGYPDETPYVPMNDMALLTLDSVVPDKQPDRLAELVRAMSLPFQKDGVEASGNIFGREFLQIATGILEQRKSGLLTIFDVHQIPIARILIANGTIPLVYYHPYDYPPAYAFFELTYREMARGFAFQPDGEFPWPDMTPISAPADRLIWEAMRRTNEIDGLYNQLGGPHARYQQVVQSFDPNSATEELRWMMGKLWEALDGYMTLEQLSYRVGADAYTCASAVRELVNRGVVSQINRKSPFHGNGTVGPPLTSHTDFEVNNWDNLQCFYLDPLSAKPIWLQGNYFGSASAAQPKNMLHTINVPLEGKGGLICKDYKLIGIHNGPQATKAAQGAPIKCFQFMWMGALLDMSVSAKKFKSAIEGEQEEGGFSSLRKNLDVDAHKGSTSDKIICPVCFSANQSYGPCQNCSNVIEEPPPEPDSSTVKGKADKAVKDIQKKIGLTKKQLIIAACILGPLFLIAMNSMPKPTKVETGTPTPEVQTSHPSSPKAQEVAVKAAGFTMSAGPDRWYEDTAELTQPNASFGIYSERTNEKIICAEFTDMSPLNSLEAFIGKPPYTEYRMANSEPEAAIIERGAQILGHGTLEWRVIRCKDKNDKECKILLAAFPSLNEGKAFLVIGQILNPEAPGESYDPKVSLGTIDQLASERTTKANKEKLEAIGEHTGDEDEDSDVPALASDADMEKFYKEVKTAVQAKLVLPEWVEEELKKPKDERRKIKVKLSVGIDSDGKVKRLEKQALSDEDLEKLSNALERAVSQASPFMNIPKFKQAEFIFTVRLAGSKVKVERAEGTSSL
jgi:hypothetical protein